MLFSPKTLRSAAWPLFALLALAAGCRPQDQIARYTVPKPQLIDPTEASQQAAPAQPQQMLAAMVLVEKAGWFFKLTGDPAVVGPLEGDFDAFMKSLTFSSGAEPEPKWELPAGWKTLPGDKNRFATIEIPGPVSTLELTVTRLVQGDVDDQTYTLNNINRWRGQLGLPELFAGELAGPSKTLKVGDYTGTQINIVGEVTGTMPGGPFAGGGGPFASGRMPPVASTNQGSGADEPKLAFKKPDGWKEAPPKVFGLAAFVTGPEDKPLEITVSSAGGDLLANVNRWRGQVGLPRITADDLDKTAAKIETLGVKADYVEAVGPTNTILGVAATVGGTQYFVKLSGDNALAQGEKANFEAFVKSLKLN